MKYFFLVLVWVLFGFTIACKSFLFNLILKELFFYNNFKGSTMQNRLKPEIDSHNFYSMLKLMYNLLLGDFDQFN